MILCKKQISHGFFGKKDVQFGINTNLWHKGIFAMENNTVYRYLGGSEEDGILACGYMQKNSQKSQLDFRIPYYSVFVLISGKGEYWDEKGFNAELKPGSVVQRLPGRVHSTRVEGEGDWREFFVSLGKGVFEALAGLGLLDSHTPVLSLGIKSGISAPNREQLARFELLLKNMKSSGGFSELLMAQALVVSLTQEGNRDKGWLDRAKAVLSAELAKPIKEEQVAAKLGLGTESFRKQFKLAVGMAPMEYRLEQRMTTARLMLLGGSLVKDVALSLGYSDAYSFSKQFKRKTGSSPLECRGEAKPG